MKKSKTGRAKAKAMKDSKNDSSGIPPLKKDVFKKAVLRPNAKKQTTLHLDPDIVEFFKKKGRGYQSVINAVLRNHVYATGPERAEEAIAASRNLLKSIVENAPIRVFWKDAELRYLGCNTAFARDAGLSRPEDLIDKDDFQMAWREQAELYRADDRRVMDSDTQKLGYVEPQTTPDGRAIWLRTSKVPLHDANGKVFGVLGIYEDITESKRAEENLKKFAEKLEQSNRELQDFAYIASHDLQEPLRKITAFGDRLKNKLSNTRDEQALDYLERMQNAASRMQRLIDSLLMYSRVSTTAQPFEPVDLAVVVKEVLSDLEVRIEQVQGRVKTGDLPTVHADPLQMRQLFQNLIGNALKFHAQGKAPVVDVSSQRIKARLNRQDGDSGEFWQITVQDNGIGFDEKHVARIFGVFQRLHGRSDYEGSGIGLSICRKIVQRHGGDITARSSPGSGSAFIFTLPASTSTQQ